MARVLVMLFIIRPNSNLKIEAVLFSEMLASTCEITLLHKPQDHIVVFSTSLIEYYKHGGNEKSEDCP
jgi:hypothetical protein